MASDGSVADCTDNGTSLTSSKSFHWSSSQGADCEGRPTHLSSPLQRCLLSAQKSTQVPQTETLLVLGGIARVAALLPLFPTF